MEMVHHFLQIPADNKSYNKHNLNAMNITIQIQQKFSSNTNTRTQVFNQIEYAKRQVIIPQEREKRKRRWRDVNYSATICILGKIRLGAITSNCKSGPQYTYSVASTLCEVSFSFNFSNAEIRLSSDSVRPFT